MLFSEDTYLQCDGSGMFIPEPGSWFLPIPDPGSKNSNKREGWKKNCCHTFFCSYKFRKIEYYFIFLKCQTKKFGPIFKELLKFLPKKLSLSSQEYGFGIRDPGSGKNLFRIPDPGVKKAPDPGSGSATLHTYIPEMGHCMYTLLGHNSRLLGIWRLGLG